MDVTGAGGYNRRASVSLSPRTRLGSYEVIGQIGAGGMGEVYRATDTNLGREVAIKVLPEAVAADSDRLARFDREARTLAALNHPNIAAIYGVEKSGGSIALVMELVEGPTLADRIAGAAIPLEEALTIARQIVDALEAAHELGIVHRDLKPANIKLRPDGTVKVLDFGLAKAIEPGVTTSHGISLTPTITTPAMTQAGVIFGTAAYMSPEQAAGKPVDRRADIWSFGVVLWEMLTGDQLFGGRESVPHTLADVLRAPVDFDRIPAGTLRELLGRCLDRDVRTRLRDIGEARVALTRTNASAAFTPIDSTRASSSIAARSSTIAWAFAALLAIATGVAVWAPWRVEPERPLVRFDVDLGADVALPPQAFDQNVVLSPDGKRLAYVAKASDGRTRLYVRRLDEDRAVEMAGSDGVMSVAFSPDSTSLAFSAANTIYRVSVQGGAALRLSDGDVSNNSLAWSEDGKSILVAGLGAGLRRIPATGGEQVKLTDLAEGEAIHAQPYPVPGGRAVLFASGTRLRNSRIEVISSSGGDRKVVVPDGTAPHFLNGGYLAFLSQGTLFAIRFDPDTLQAHGDAVPIVTDVKMTYSGLAPVGTFSVSSDGTLVYRKAVGPLGPPGPASGRRSTIFWIDAAGKQTPLLSKVGAYYDPRVSPDGSQIALTLIDTPTPSVASYDPRRDALTRLSFDGANVNSIWSRPEGRYVVFVKLGVGNDGTLQWTRVGAGQPQTLVAGGVRALGSFSPDGKRLAYVRRGDTKGRPLSMQIVTVPVTEEDGQLKAGSPELFSSPQFNEMSPEFSPDGKWIAFVTDPFGP